MNLYRILVIAPLFLADSLFAQPLTLPTSDARRLEVLFFGAPTANHPGHDPITRYRAIKKNLGTEGIDFTYTEDPKEAFNPETLSHYDAVLMYGNWDQNGPLPAPQLSALTGYINNGGGFLPIHCASASFGGSPEFIHLVGGRFKEHGTGVFKVANVKPDHPIMHNYPGYEAWDESYVHDRLGDDRLVLEKREDEPWTWVRQQGKGRVFYTAAGHDHRVWDLPEFHDFIKRAIFWSVGPDSYKKLQALNLPNLAQEEVKLPGYQQRKLITKAQKPVSPADSMKLAQVPAGFELSLFAREPDIVNPIFVSWDHKGRAFVVQTTDYPNNLQAGNLGHDKIIICDDTNGDGRADQFTTFAEKLSIPTSLTFANGGVICTNGPDMLFLQDTNGDDVADVRKVLFSGFSMGDTHAGVSNLRYAPDGWVYATVGYSGFRGTVGGEQQQFSQAVFRFKPDGSKMEVLQNTTNNTWGLGFTADFDVMGSTANGNPSFYLTYPPNAYTSAGLTQPRTPRADNYQGGPNNPATFNPSSVDIRQVDFFDSYTAAAGHAIYTAERFPASWRDKTAFITEPTGKLVATFDVSRDGAGFKSIQRSNNLFNSADAWSAPVCAEIGPDGAVWICDWYNLIIQHNPQPSRQSSGLDATTGRGNAYETPLRDKSYGRIYRIYPVGSKDEPNPGLDTKKPGSLISGLGNSNLLWRVHAQRLIVEGAMKDLTPKLTTLATSGERGAAEAIRALAQLGTLDSKTVDAALKSNIRSVSRAGISQATPAQLTAAFVTGGSFAGLEARELAEVFVGLSNGPASPEVCKALFDWAVKEERALTRDGSLKDAWQIAANRLAEGMIVAAADQGFGSEEDAPAPPNLLQNPDFSEAQGELPRGWGRITTHNGATRPTLKASISPEGRNGTPCLKIESDRPSDSGPAVNVRLRKNTRYRFTAWVRTENLTPAGGAPGVVINVQGGERSSGVKGTTDWTQLSMEFSSEDNERMTVNLLFGGYGGATGAAYFDDVSLTEVSGGSGLAGMMRLAGMQFLTKADATARNSLTAKLQGKPGGFARKLLSELASTPTTAVAAKEKKFKADSEVHARGAAVYALTCIACHQPDGKGMPGAFPTLDGSEWLTGEKSVPIRVLLHGLIGPVKVAGQDFNSVMPAHIDLDDAKVSDVLTYVRQSWSNDAAPVTAAEVKALRERFADRKDPWTAKDLGH